MAGFPIFVEVDNKAPLINGGGELAFVKARLLLKRAKHVDFTTDRPCASITNLVEKGQATVIEGKPTAATIKARPLVISAMQDDEEDRRVSQIAKSLGVPVNVPDRPELCSFSLAAIVDRGLLTVAIGTEGAAPVLATRLRGWLEQNLHPRLSTLTQIARDTRDRVAAKLPAGNPRRAFWERIFGGPAARSILAGDIDEGRELIEAELAGTAATNSESVGRVLLIGAGPGDPDLLTLKAVRALKTADVILTDNLAGEAVLEHARREAQIINVGKARGRHSRTQAEINAMISSFAREGKTVVRLKGGDPFVFGRGGEEIDELRASGVECDVIPGITAATAAAASLQIPLTHRDLSRAVTFISGHAAGDGSPDFSHIDFKALADSRNTLVVYMGVATSGTLAGALLQSGWSPATPVMAVERATHETERRVATTLDVLANNPERLNLKGPALLVLGEVAGLTPSGHVETIAAERPAAIDCEVSNDA